MNNIRKPLLSLGLGEHREEAVFPSEKNHLDGSGSAGGTGCCSGWVVGTVEGGTAIVEDAA